MVITAEVASPLNLVAFVDNSSLLLGFQFLRHVNASRITVDAAFSPLKQIFHVSQAANEAAKIKVLLFIMSLKLLLR